MNTVLDAESAELTVSMAAVDAAAARAVLADHLHLAGVDLEHPVVVTVLAAVVSAGWRPRPVAAVADGPVPASVVDEDMAALFGDLDELASAPHVPGWAR